MDLRKRYYKIGKNFVSDPELNIIDDYTTMGLQKMSFIEPAESCPH